jgi:hypothetical protein
VAEWSEDKPKKEDKPRFPRLLICEGPEDERFFRHFIETRNLPRFHIQSTGGRRKPAGNSKFGDALSKFQIERPKTFRQLKHVLIVADNDDHPEDNFKNVCQQVDGVFGAGSAPANPLLASAATPAITILMIPWSGEPGHLEKLCVAAAKDSDRGVGSNVDTFLAMIGADRWQSESRRAKAWLRVNLAARCASDPFIPLGTIFDESRHNGLIPVGHPSLKRIADVLASFA